MSNAAVALNDNVAIKVENPGTNMTDHEWTRFAESIAVDAVSGCWLWQKRKDKDGYGIFHFRRKARRAHRCGWFAKHGDLPEGMVVDHLHCRTRNCVNPDHVRLVTPSVNSTENTSSCAARNRDKTHCKNGHPFDRAYGEGKKRQRYCSICEAAKTKRLRKKWAAEDTLNV